MPVLPSEYLSTWYRLRNRNGLCWLVQNWSEKQLQQAQVKPLIQGDIGVRAMDVGGTYFEHSISTPALIVETPIVSPDTCINDRIHSALYLLADSFNQTRTPFYTTTQLDYVLKSGSIKISEAGVMVDIGLYSDVSSALIPEYLPPVEDYIARVARWYDCNFYVQDSNLSSVYQVKSGSINFAVNVEMAYFIGTDQSPYFVVQGYEVNGDLEILISPAQYETLLQTSGGVMKRQDAGNLRAHLADPAYFNQQISLSIGNTNNRTVLYFGKAFLMTEVERGMQPNQITTLRVSFKTFINSSTPMSVTENRPYLFGS